MDKIHYNKYYNVFTIFLHTSSICYVALDTYNENSIFAADTFLISFASIVIVLS